MGKLIRGKWDEMFKLTTDVDIHEFINSALVTTQLHFHDVKDHNPSDNSLFVQIGYTKNKITAEEKKEREAVNQKVQKESWDLYDEGEITLEQMKQRIENLSYVKPLEYSFNKFDMPDMNEIGKRAAKTAGIPENEIDRFIKGTQPLATMAIENIILKDIKQSIAIQAKQENINLYFVSLSIKCLAESREVETNKLIQKQSEMIAMFIEDYQQNKFVVQFKLSGNSVEKESIQFYPVYSDSEEKHHQSQWDEIKKWFGLFPHQKNIVDIENLLNLNNGQEN